MVVKNNGNVFGSWTEIENTLIRKSLRPGATNQQIDFDVNNQFSGNAFHSVYG